MIGIIGVRPALSLAGAEEEKHNGADGVDPRHQPEHLLPRLHRRLLVRERAHRERRADRAEVGERVCESHDPAGVQRRQVQLVHADARHAHAHADHRKEEDGDCGEAVAADVAGEDEETAGRDEAEDAERLADDGRRQAAGRAQPVDERGRDGHGEE